MDIKVFHGMLESQPMLRKKSIIQTFYIESLGCPKNSVDSRSMAEMLVVAGKTEVGDSLDANLILVNTCGFIRPAVEESVSVLVEFANKKKEDQILIAAGCLSERIKEDLFAQVPGLDAVFGTRRWADILKMVVQIESGSQRPFTSFPDATRLMEGPSGVLRAASMGGSAYLKIADGCDRGCAFCAIPLIKGPMVSRPLEDILSDARRLENQGTQELILIAQDITMYGKDLEMKDGLVHLLSSLVNAVPGIPWIRLMYTFPGSFPDNFIQLMAEENQILNYLDIPLQHAHPQVLKRMRRPANMNQVRNQISHMRSVIPDLAIRSTFITGFPGETDAEFNTLKKFIEEIRFDHVGFFPYYHEPDTPAYDLEDLPDNVKNERLQVLAALQEKISLEKNQRLIGKSMDVLIEGSGDGISVGRSYRDAPEIDGLVILNEILTAGKILSVQITGALVHDLLAEIT